MRNFQGIAFIWTQIYREIFKSALVYLSYSVVFIKNLRHFCFPGKFMNFSEEATKGVLRKKLFLKFSQYSQESHKPATLLKTDSNTGVLLWMLQNF